MINSVIISKKEIKELQNLIVDRYDLHSEFVAEYKLLSDLQKSLYSILVDESTELVDLQNKVAEINTQNETVHSTINAFNESTQEVNQAKEKVSESFKESK